MTVLPQDTRAPHRNQRWVECTGATTAYAVMHVADASREETVRTILELESPTEDDQTNGIFVVGPNADICTNDYPTYALYDSTNTPAAGEEWGVESGSLLLHKNRLGFIILGDADGTKVRVMRTCPTAGLVELCAQATATRSTPYDCLLGVWDPAEDKYCYDNASTVKAIDYRMGPPLAETGWRGMYQPMKSDTYGILYVCVSLDCEVPDEGCVECEES